MIKGALIFAAGLAIGYTKAMSQLPEVKEFFVGLNLAWEETSRLKATTVETNYDVGTHTPQGETLS